MYRFEFINIGFQPYYTTIHCMIMFKNEISDTPDDVLTYCIDDLIFYDANSKSFVFFF